MAVDTGYWPLYRFDPRRVDKKTNPFQLDSKRIREDLKKYLKLQNRFGKLERAKPAHAEKLQSKLQNFSKERHEGFIRTSLDDEDYFSYLQQKLGKFGIDEDSEKIYVMYGSETGNARSQADVIVHELKRRNNTNIKLISMDDFDFNELLEYESEDNINIIFSISTCGQGEL
eukprot:716918_1